MNVFQDLVDRVGVPAARRRTLAGRTTAAQRPDAGHAACGAGFCRPEGFRLSRLPPGETFCLARQIVQRAGGTGSGAGSV